MEERGRRADRGLAVPDLFFSFSLLPVGTVLRFCHVVLWAPFAATTTAALLILYLCLGGFFVGMLAVSKKIRNDGNTVRVVGRSFVGWAWIWSAIVCVAGARRR